MLSKKGYGVSPMMGAFTTVFCTIWVTGDMPTASRLFLPF